MGRVQGVGFRATAKNLASAHGVAGWVRNEADGSVRLVAEGPEEVVSAYLAELRERLRDSISNEKIETDDASGRYAGFEIR